MIAVYTSSLATMTYAIGMCQQDMVNSDRLWTTNLGARTSELPLWEESTSPSKWGEIGPTTCIVRCSSEISHWSSFVSDGIKTTPLSGESHLT